MGGTRIINVRNVKVKEYNRYSRRIWAGAHKYLKRGKNEVERRKSKIEGTNAGRVIKKARKSIEKLRKK